MKLLRVIASGFKNLQDNTDINLVAQSKKTSEDKEYELVNIAEELYVYSTAAFIGKNASGKTTAIDLLDCCYSILGNFSIDGYGKCKLYLYFENPNCISIKLKDGRYIFFNSKSNDETLRYYAELQKLLEK